MSRIYLVDDHAIVRDGLRSILERGGHQVVGEAAEPAAALAGLLALAPDVLLLDLALEGHSGFELLSEVHRRGMAVRTLVLTMSVQARDVAEAVRLGAAAYLPKDSSVAQLLGAIEAALQGGPFFGPEKAQAGLTLADRGPADALAELSPRERQIIAMVVQGQTSAAIARQLDLSPKTVDSYRSRLMIKLGVPDITSLVRFAIRAGLIDN